MKITVRFVEQALGDKGSLGSQARAVQDQDSLRELTISDVGIEMLTAIVGRGMTPSVRRHVGRSLYETMHGEIPSEDRSEGDILTEVYGEIFGPLLTCLERNGDYEIIRLVSPHNSTCPDVLLVDRTCGHLILQECKAVYTDSHAVLRQPSPLDVCARIRKRRNEGLEQLLWPGPDSVTARRVRVKPRRQPLLVPFECHEESVAVTAIPDGRLRDTQFSSRPPRRKACATACVRGCLFAPEPTMLTVLSTRRCDANPEDGSLRAFLDRYKECERAIWGKAHGLFGQAYSALLSAWSDLRLRLDSSSHGLLLGLVESAIAQRVFVDFPPIWKTSGSLENAGLVAELRGLHDLQGDMVRPRVGETSGRDFGRLLTGGREKQVPGEGPMGNWTFRARRGGRGNEREGSVVEAHVRSRMRGVTEILMCLKGASNPEAVENLCWGLAEILAADEVPPEMVYELFEDEPVRWLRVASREEREFGLGKVLGAHWPGWPWPVGRNVLQRMHNCCPYCDELAHILEHRWHPLHPWYWHRHRHDGPGFPWAEPVAFVTTDGRAVLRVANIR